MAIVERALGGRRARKLRAVFPERALKGEKVVVTEVMYLLIIAVENGRWYGGECWWSAFMCATAPLRNGLTKLSSRSVGTEALLARLLLRCLLPLLQNHCHRCISCPLHFSRSETGTTLIQQYFTFTNLASPVRFSIHVNVSGCGVSKRPYWSLFEPLCSYKQILRLRRMRMRLMNCHISPDPVHMSFSSPFAISVHLLPTHLLCKTPHSFLAPCT